MQRHTQAIPANLTSLQRLVTTTACALGIDTFCGTYSFAEPPWFTLWQRFAKNLAPGVTGPASRLIIILLIIHWTVVSDPQGWALPNSVIAKWLLRGCTFFGLRFQTLGGDLFTEHPLGTVHFNGGLRGQAIL